MQRGFTIIELMAVVTIVAILATIAAPNMRDMVILSRVKTAASDLHTGLLFARSEAIKRNADVEVAATDASSPPDWSKGWSVKFGTTTLETYQAYENVTFTTRNPATGAAVTVPVSILFKGTGRSGNTDVSFVLTATGYPTIAARCVRMDPSGRPKVLLDKDGDSSNGCL